jgi:hypothetical protein
LAAHVEELWNEWEIQVLVLVSFSLQVFLLLFSGIRKRITSKVLSILLWLAYLSADSLAVFVLGHLTLHINGGLRHGLVLFWAPFMLLHLGGQDTMTAFSMEDNMLWKRHLLNFATQVGLAAYVVGKQWQGGGKPQLLAPMVLMFISGTIKYAGRISALRFAVKNTTLGGSVGFMAQQYTLNLGADRFWAHDWMINEAPTYRRLVSAATSEFIFCMAFLMDMTRLKYRHSLQGLLSKQYRVQVCYKLTELQLSIAYEFLYTKLGQMHFSGGLLNSWFSKLVTLGCTFAALFLFAWDDLKGSLLPNYKRADIIVSYILLGGAAILEVLSVSIAISPFSAYYTTDDAVENNVYNKRYSDVMFSIIRYVHPESKPQWSQKLAQYNLIGECIRWKQEDDAGDGSLMQCAISQVKSRKTTAHVDVSHELKKLVLDRLLQVGTTIHPADLDSDDVWDMSNFTGQWAKLEIRSKMQSSSEAAARLQTLISNTTERSESFMFSVLTWHIVTEICFFQQHSNSGDGGSSSSSSSSAPPSCRCRDPSRQLSRYVMYLCAKHGILSGNDGYVSFTVIKQVIMECLLLYEGALDERSVVIRIADMIHGENGNLVQRTRFVDGVLSPTSQLAKELLMIEDANYRWDIIMNVWMEMLCYMALHSEHGFHTTHLSKGGEFLTHVKLLILNIFGH